jgi:hypothetical protein
MATNVQSFDGRTVKFYLRGEPLHFVSGPSPFVFREYDVTDIETAKKIFATEATGCNVIYEVDIRRLFSIFQQPKITISGFRAKVL